MVAPRIQNKIIPNSKKVTHENAEGNSCFTEEEMPWKSDSPAEKTNNKRKFERIAGEFAWEILTKIHTFCTKSTDFA